MTGPRKPIRKPPAGGRPNTLGLGQRELGDLLDRLESPEGAAKNPKRDFVRWPFRRTSIRVQFLYNGGTSSWITVACRNISRTGIALLHSSYAHTGTKCRVMLPHPTRGEVALDGWVTRCSHRSGVVHELGIRFEHHLDVQEYLPAAPFADWFSLERVNPEALTGTVVCAAESELDRKILRHFLRGTKLNLIMAGSGHEALTAIDDSIDLALVEFHLGDMTGADLASRLHEKAVDVPLVILTPDCHAAPPQLMASMKVSAFLAKPINQDLLLRAIGEFLIVRRAPGLPRIAVDRGVASPALVQGMLAALGQYATKLEECIRLGDAAAARTVCLQVAGTSGTIGFKEVSQLATKAADALTRSRSTSESVSAIRALISICRGSSGRLPGVAHGRAGDAASSAA
jgi:CheY-like chemotaxis protein